eukprot:gnl/TRDRNA2_/TRDRNA2_185452_c0_seq1.p1 gnl/TRDRNA2_/TRDRNA2_185452_c0~~gnl/TRDRNA2_/TRDRNA2_185452_c0_seq1.p1  ORF type:complete len:703 (+),score=165.68 gnl/TRDRNA2_/TRDRNA2_185452_c0_seq1:116-2224(+)
MHQELSEALTAGDEESMRELLSRLELKERETWLHDNIMRAAYDNQAKKLVAVLHVGASPFVVDDVGKTPLHWAARQGHEEATRILIESNASIEAINQDGMTPLHLASEYNVGGVVSKLLTQKADPYKATPDHRTPLHLASERGSTIAAAVLLDWAVQKAKDKVAAETAEVAAKAAADQALAAAKAKAKAKPAAKADPKAKAAAKPADEGEGAAAPPPPPPAPAISIDTAFLEPPNDRGETPLMRASARGHAPLVQLLLKKSANPALTNFWGQSCLQLAAAGGHVGAVATILDTGRVGVNDVSQDKSTALHSAVERGHAKVTELLLARKAFVDLAKTGGRLPLHQASERGCLAAVEALLARGAATEAASDEGRTALMYAAARGHAPVVKCLLDKHADVLKVDAARQSALHLAAVSGRVEVIDHLILGRARIDSEDGGARTALMLSIESSQDGAVKVLLKRGAVLPEALPGEDAAKGTKLAKLMDEVEREVLEEQLVQAEQGTGLSIMEAAERGFEDARLELIRLATQVYASNGAPAINFAELQLKDAQETERLLLASVTDLDVQVNEVVNEISTNVAKTAQLQRDVEYEKRAVNLAKDKLVDKRKDVIAAKGKLSDALSAAEANRREEEKLVKPCEDAKEAIECAKSAIAAVRRSYQDADEELRQVLEELDRWHQERQRAAIFTTQAQLLLNRHKTSPSNTPR